MILFGDEASFAQWGSLSYTWAPKGQQPTVKTSGKRKGYKVFGLINFFSEFVNLSAVSLAAGDCCGNILGSRIK